MQKNRRRPIGRGVLIAGAVLVALGLVTATGALVALQTSYTTVTARRAMEPTHRDGDLVPIEKIGGAAVRRGDVVLYKVSNRYGGLPVLQRVIGLGGDHLVLADGSLTVNGRTVREPYVKQADARLSTPDLDVMVPPGRMFLLGDNRENSNDSRYFLSENSGTVPTAAIQGRALASGTAPVMLGLTVVLGVLCTVGGGICVLAGRRTRPAWTSPGPAAFA
ncbi:signal peptidase I [Streptomyces scopuliridis]|uniref:signal peptidase I n=1 Tax=Streptomyces scopuliridis TaxID=452529 RepID=UPI0036B785F6